VRNYRQLNISKIKTSAKLPHVPQRREGDNRITRDTDDIMSLLTCIDENKLFDQLPGYMLLTT